MLVWTHSMVWTGLGGLVIQWNPGTEYPSPSPQDIELVFSLQAHVNINCTGFCTAIIADCLDLAPARCICQLQAPGGGSYIFPEIAHFTRSDRRKLFCVEFYNLLNHTYLRGALYGFRLHCHNPSMRSCFILTGINPNYNREQLWIQEQLRSLLSSQSAIGYSTWAISRVIPHVTWPAFTYLQLPFCYMSLQSVPWPGKLILAKVGSSNHCFGKNGS